MAAKQNQTCSNKGTVKDRQQRATPGHQTPTHGTPTPHVYTGQTPRLLPNRPDTPCTAKRVLPNWRVQTGQTHRSHHSPRKKVEKTIHGKNKEQQPHSRGKTRTNEQATNQDQQQSDINNNQTSPTTIRHRGT